MRITPVQTLVLMAFALCYNFYLHSNYFILSLLKHLNKTSMEELKELITQLEFKVYHHRRLGHIIDLERAEYELSEAKRQLQELTNNQINK